MTEPKPRLRQLREQKGLTEEEVAEGIDMSVSSVSRHETAKTRPSRKTLQKYAEFYGVHIIELFWDVKICPPHLEGLLADLEALPEDELDTARKVISSLSGRTAA